MQFVRSTLSPSGGTACRSGKCSPWSLAGTYCKRSCIWPASSSCRPACSLSSFLTEEGYRWGSISSGSCRHGRFNSGATRPHGGWYTHHHLVITEPASNNPHGSTSTPYCLSSSASHARSAPYSAWYRLFAPAKGLWRWDARLHWSETHRNTPRKGEGWALSFYSGGSASWNMSLTRLMPPYRSFS